ncbi:hypothetical protein PABG_07121 [Paracoccidioides brasiliensis Pb03]|nr:hypothetical protein PABG_07121 [Paracoccidioides brasiliensis Pb03]
MADVCTFRRVNTPVDHQTDEVFNIQSQERANLLSEIKDAIQSSTVKAPLWACMQVCDISKLRELVTAARNSPAMFSLFNNTCLSIPLRWMQHPPLDHVSSTPSTLSSAEISAHSDQRHRRVKPKTLAKERDRYSCAITEGEVFEVAHIFPHFMINTKPSTNLDASIPPFWNLLDVFFEPDRLNRWRAEIFNDPSNPDKSTDGCHNTICLSPTAHRLWAKAMFALRPVSLSDDRKELAVQFYWQPRPAHGCFDSVNILESPGSSRDLVRVGANVLSIAAHDNATSAVAIKSGHIFVFRTTNPNTHPLPSFELLDMQWHLQRIVSMSGSAEIYDEDNGDDDGDHLDAGIIHKTFSDILAWVSTPLSHSGSDDDFSRSPASISTYPLRTIERPSKNLFC